MKKLELNKMENIIGEGKNRDCMAMGVLTALSLVTVPFTAGAITFGLAAGAIAMGCLD